MQAGTVVHHPQFGPAMPSLNWIPAPRYVLRRDRVLALLKDMPPCRVLDIGCGPGALISELAARGFDAYGVDRSVKAQELGRQLESQSPGMKFRPQLEEKWKGTFDLVMSFEVIEHLQDDVGAMREWRQYLKPGGRLIISVPAHQDRWNAADEWAGHVRRYERGQLVRAVEAAGFKVEKVECYGFPLANVMEKLTAPTYRRKLKDKTDAFTDADTLTDDSGSDRSTHARYWPIYSSVLPVSAMNFFCLLQRAFLKTNFGTGFILIAKARLSR
jgi:SAM-dependent methyltransferase